MSADGEQPAAVVGFAHFDLMSDGTVAVNIEGLAYMHMYGIAGVITEMARSQQAQQMLMDMAKRGDKIIVPNFGKGG